MQKGDYTGDSIQNSLGDVVSASLGYWICVGSVRIDCPWIPALWFIVTELALAIAIRDGLILTIIQVGSFSRWPIRYDGTNIKYVCGFFLWHSY